MLRKTTIHDLIRQKTDLARTYADDGAFHSAARVLGDLAQDVKAHAMACDKALERMIAKGGAS